MRHYICIAFLLIGFSINAQNNVATNLSEVDSIFLPKLTGVIYVPETEHIGEIFFNNKWVKSNILLSTGVMVYGEKLRYNGFSDGVIWLNSSNYSQFILDRSYISDFWTKDSLDNPVHFKHLYASDSIASNPKDIFAVVAMEGNISLYIQRKISHKEDAIVDKENGHFYINILDSTPLYYIKLPSGRYLKMSRLGRRSFLNLFSEQKKSISKLVRKNHIKLRSESGLIKVIELMNENNID
jgi:hypothetical protein